MVRVWITTRNRHKFFIGEMTPKKFEVLFYPYKKKIIADNEYEVNVPIDVYSYYTEKN